MIRRVTVQGQGDGILHVWRSLGFCATAPTGEPGFVIHGTIFAATARAEGKITVELLTHDPNDPRHVSVPNPVGPGFCQVLGDAPQ